MTKAANLAALGSVVEVPTGSAPSFQCRAWVNFNGTGTVAIRASGNVSSITDNGTGDYTVNFTTAMPDANYSIVGALNWDNTGSVNLVFSVQSAYATSSVRFKSAYGVNNVLYDALACNVSIFR
jgi:hypothetical protein